MQIRFLTALTFALAPSPSARGAEVLILERALDAIARSVAGMLQGEPNARQIVVNPITDRTDLTHTAGTGITEILIEKLCGQGLKPALRAEFLFDGKYLVGEEASGDVRKGIAIGSLAFTVRRRNGQTVFDSERALPLERRPRVTDPGDLARMGGVTVALSSAAPAAENGKKLLDALDNLARFLTVRRNVCGFRAAITVRYDKE